MARMNRTGQIRKDVKQFGFKTGFAYLTTANREAQHKHSLFVKAAREGGLDDKTTENHAKGTMNQLLEIKDVVSALVTEFRKQMPDNFIWPDLEKLIPKQDLTDVDKP